MGNLINFVFGTSTVGEAFANNPSLAIFNMVVIILIAIIIIIFTAWVHSRFSSKSGHNFTNVTSYGQGGQGGSGGGHGGRGGDVFKNEKFPLEAGNYEIKVGRGGTNEGPRESSSITTPSGQIIMVGGGESGKAQSSDSTKSD